MIDIKKIQKIKPLKELLEFSIINIDKPDGPTSFEVDVTVKNCLNLKKVSHFGTLDPMVGGVLPLALNRACRLMPYFIGKRKNYVGIMRMHNEIGIDELKKEIHNFIGEIVQLPPVKSRVKRAERKRTIYNFEILEKNGKDVLFETEVEAGTYIRKLVHDIGLKIGGAHMLELRRTKASIFDEKNSIKMFDFLDAVKKYKEDDETALREMLIPGEIISDVLPVVKITEKYLGKLYHGSPLFREYLRESKEFEALNEDDKIAVFYEEVFIGVFIVVKGKDVVAKAEFILQPIK